VAVDVKVATPGVAVKGRAVPVRVTLAAAVATVVLVAVLTTLVLVAVLATVVRVAVATDVLVAVLATVVFVAVPGTLVLVAVRVRVEVLEATTVAVLVRVVVDVAVGGVPVTVCVGVVVEVAVPQGGRVNSNSRPVLVVEAVLHSYCVNTVLFFCTPTVAPPPVESIVPYTISKLPPLFSCSSTSKSTSVPAVHVVDPDRIQLRHSATNVRLGAVPITSVKMPLPAGAVFRSSQ
jgi:hypothetical protein